MTDPVNYRRLQWLLVAAVSIALLAVAAVVGFALWEADRRDAERAERQREIAEQVKRNETARLALCAQRADVEQRLASEWRRVLATRKILLEHAGEPLIFAIPRELLEDSQRRARADLEQTKRTRENLAILDCKKS